ncbi:sensor histidine kinase, partial [Streptomyces scabiei]|nr:sensor histidine kinase [Streptomyces scabiei]
MNGVEKRLTKGLRVLRQDLWSATPHPLPPSVWLRWLPHGMVFLIAFGTTMAAADQMVDRYGLGTEYGLLCAVVQGGAVSLALWRPVPAWWLSTVLMAVAAVGARAHLALNPTSDNQPFWPWTGSGIFAHATVLFLLALRLPTRVSAEVLALTALLTYVLQEFVGSANHEPSGMLALAMFTGVTILGGALRGRREAR